MKLVWIHGAVDQSVTSLASSLCIHNTQYSGTATSDHFATQMGEICAGMFGSGSTNAIDYLADFPYERMVHCDMRDVQRSGIRILDKVLYTLGGQELRFWRQRQAIDGHTEYYSQFRPQHVREPHDFGLHTGVLSKYFRAYYHQFDEFAHEGKFGIEVQDHEPISAVGSGAGEANEPGELASSLGHLFPAAGDYLKRPEYLKQKSEDYVSSGRLQPAPTAAMVPATRRRETLPGTSTYPPQIPGMVPRSTPTGGNLTNR